MLLGIVPAFAWETERPSAYFAINSREDNAGTNDEASVGLGVHVQEYKENWYDDWRDGVTLRVIATANTRKAITYGQTVFSGLIDWVEATALTGITGDNSGVWLTLPFPVRFYGGPGYPYESAEYRSVWVSSNGFLSFDSDSTSYDPKPIPDESMPNTLLAVYWSDLDPTGGSIKYYSDSTIFVVLWDNVLNKRNGYRQTFEVIIEDLMVPGGGRGQNRIKFLYESVTWSSDAIVGIEDQEGYKGTMPNPFPQSGEGVMFTTLREAPEIKRITIKLQKSDSSAVIDIDTNTGPANMAPKGHNIVLLGEEPDPEGLLERAVTGYGSLLVSSVLKELLGVGFVGGLIIGGILVTIPLALDYARSLSPANVPPADIVDAYESDNLAYIRASADTASSWGWPVDASVGIQVYWVFNDHNTLDHSLTITAELEYYSYDSFNEVTLVSNTVTLSFMHEVEPKSVSIPVNITGSLGVDDQEDIYTFTIYVSTDPPIHVTMNPAPDADFDLEVLDSNGVVVGSSKNRGVGLTETIDYFVSETSTWYVKVLYYPGSNNGLYSLQITDPAGGGGGNWRIFMVPY